MSANKNQKYFIELRTENKNVVVLPVDTVIAEEANLQSVYKYAGSKLVPHLEKAAGGRRPAHAASKKRLDTVGPLHHTATAKRSQSKAVLEALRSRQPV